MSLLKKIYSLRHHTGFKRYAANTSWLMGEKLLRMFVGLFVGIWVARYLGPEQFGLLSYAQSFVFLFTAIATLGLDNIVVRELVKDQERQDVLLGTAFILKLIGAIMLLPLLLIAIQFTGNDTYTNYLVFLIASATIFQSFNVIDFFYQSKVQSKYVAIANSLMLGISSLVKITLIVNEAPLTAFAVMMLFDNILLSLGLIYFYNSRSRLKLKNWKFEKQTAKALLYNSWPLILSSLVISVYMKIDQVMLKEMLNVEAVGQYAVSVKLTEAWYFIPMVISSSIFPSVMKSKIVSEEVYYLRLKWLFTLMVWLAIIVAIPISFFSNDIVALLFGDEFLEAASVLKIYIWSSVFVFLGVSSSKWFLAENLQNLLFWRTFYGMLVNIILNLYLIPKYGPSGAAIATVCANFTAAFLFDLINIRTRRIFYLKLSAFIPLKKGNYD